MEDTMLIPLATTRPLRGLRTALAAIALGVPLFVALPAAHAAPVRAPAEIDGCLVGTWSSSDLETYARSALNAGVSPISIDGVSGTMRLQFRPDDTFVQHFDGMVVRAQARGMATVQTINGDASGRIEQDPAGQLLLSGEAGAITMDMSIDNQTVLQGADVSSLALASRELGPTRATFSCEGDRLELSPMFPDGRPVQPMIFGRTG
jgi:hypothetical protein